MRNSSQSGNAIFMILLAVALFAAIGIAFMGGSRTSTTMLSDEQAKAYASQIIAYGSEIQGAVKILQMRGCKDTHISFEDSTLTGYGNTNSPPDSCKVYHVKGGGLGYKAPDSNWLDPAYAASPPLFYGSLYITGQTCIEDMGGDETNCHTDGIDNNDLILFIPYVRPEICTIINKNLGVTNLPEELNSLTWGTTYRFRGPYTEQATRFDGPNIGKQKEACFRSGGTTTSPTNGSYSYYLVLIAR